LAAAVLLLLAAPLGAEASGSGKKSIWGPVSLPDGSSAFSVYRELGVDTLQLDIGWHDVAPERPQQERNPADPAYQWGDTIDTAIRRARRNGMHIALMVRGSPLWANGNRNTAWAPEPRLFRRFVTAATRRYPSVRHWMIWGESNRRPVFKPLPPNRPRGPRVYAKLLAAAYKGLKAVNPRNRVIGGMTWSFGDMYPADFLRWMRLPNGKPPPLDLYGHNPFTLRPPDLSDGEYVGYPKARDFGELDRLHDDLERVYRGRYPQFSRSGPKLWLSEFGVSSDRNTLEFPFHVSREEQARWLTASFADAARTPWISTIGWMRLVDEPASDPVGATSGLMTYEGERKPAYRAYRRAP
jgi:hypothetical protein